MIVGYLHFGGTRVRPYEADTKLIVDANAVFSTSVACQPLKSVARRYAKVAQNGSGIELVELSPRYSPYCLRTYPPGRSGGASIEDILGSTIPVRHDHRSIVAWCPCYNQAVPTRLRSPVLIQDGPLTGTADSTEPFNAISSALMPDASLSSSMGTV